MLRRGAAEEVAIDGGSVAPMTSALGSAHCETIPPYSSITEPLANSGARWWILAPASRICASPGNAAATAFHSAGGIAPSAAAAAERKGRGIRRRLRHNADANS